MSNKSYGGKLGVWLGKKRSANVNNRNRQRARNMMHTLLPATLFGSKGQSLGGSGIGRMRAKAKPPDEARSKMSWDDVRCRPVYYSTPGDSTIDNDETKISKVGDGDTVNLRDHFIDSESGKIFHERPQDGIFERPSFWSDNKGSRGKNGKRYGTQKEKRLGRISSMTSAVMDQCASPLWEKRHVGKHKRKGTTKKISGFASEGSSVATSNNVLETVLSPMSTPRQLSSASVVPSGISATESSSKFLDVNDSFGGLEVVQESLSFIKDESTEKRTAQRNHPQPRKRKILIGEKSTPRKASKKRLGNIESKDDNNGILESDDNRTRYGMLRQPTSSTSLTDARAYFLYLDATQELNIDST